ncbi:MFS transporter [Pseudomonas sp. NPDC007930]|uniref:MFS transporter n=1 Tax=Pseudomonas sp. NPDC007930 TaxID=3364417 RepID=UPI0036ED8229
MPTPRPFTLFCAACYLLSLAYGATFLLNPLVHTFGAGEAEASQVFAVMMVSTLLAVLASGHALQSLGAARAIALGAASLVAASLGFAVVPGVGAALAACGVLLGIGWGLFYTVGPIMVAAMVEPARRTHCFALLSGSMLSGIGSAPLLGALAGRAGWPVQAVFACAGAAALLGGAYFWRLGADGQRPAGPVRLSVAASAAVLRSPARWSILLVGLGGAIFGTLGSFQTRYALDHGVDYSLFFMGFMGAAIACRLLVAGWVVKRPPLPTAALLTSLILLAVLLFARGVQGNASYLLAAALLGVGYGLNYSVINGLAASEAPPGLTAQALLLFSLAYFIGVFGFPALAGRLISHTGVHGMLLAVLAVALAVWLVSLGRWLGRLAGQPGPRTER